MLETLQSADRLTNNENIAIVALSIFCGLLAAAVVAQWFAAKAAKDEYRADIKALSDKFDAGVTNAFSYVDKISEVVEKATVKLELLLDRRSSSRD